MWVTITGMPWQDSGVNLPVVGQNTIEPKSPRNMNCFYLSEAH